MQLLMMNAINNQHLRSWRWWGKDESPSQKLEFLVSEPERPIGDNQYPRNFFELSWLIDGGLNIFR
jgi:hypothetical protein